MVKFCVCGSMVVGEIHKFVGPRLLVNTSRVCVCVCVCMDLEGGICFVCLFVFVCLFIFFLTILFSGWTGDDLINHHTGCPRMLYKENIKSTLCNDNT